MKEFTDEFSFILKPSEHGVGVFATHDIAKNTHLRLFGDGEVINLRSIEREAKDVPTIFHDYCMSRGESLVCPEDFGHMHVGWYLNHAEKANTYRDNDFKWYAQNDIKEGDEITINYNTLEEPEEEKEDYYSK